MSLPRPRWTVVCALALTTCLLVGCTDRPAILPNPDPALRKKTTHFAADAAKRFPYPADAPSGGEAEARAMIGYMLDRMDVVNLSGEDWTDVDVWVNGEYVIHIPTMKSKDLKRVEFKALYNDKGDHFPTSNTKVVVKKVEIFRDGKLYSVVTRVGD